MSDLKEWSNLVTRLANKGLIAIRYTPQIGEFYDYLHREDQRNITHINGNKLPIEIPVVSLRYAKQNNLQQTARLLVKLDNQ